MERSEFILRGFLDTLSYCIIFKVLLDILIMPKFRDIKIYIYLIIMCLVIFPLNINIFNIGDMITHRILMVIVATLFVKVNYDISYSKAVVISVLYLIIEFLISWFLFYFRGNGGDIYWALTNLLLENIILIILLIFLDYIKKIKSKYDDYILLGLVILVNIIAIFYFNFEYKTAAQMVSVRFILPYLLVISTIILFLYTKRVIKYHKIEAENKIIENKLNMQYRHYLNMQKSYMKLKHIEHDMKNHLICIENLCDENESARKYMKSLDNQIDEFKNIYNTGNMILDIILYEKSNRCLEDKIDFLANINFKKCNFIEPIDVCSIFANILDNAIEACLKEDKDFCSEREKSNILSSENSYIKIIGSVVKQYYIIKCENSMSDIIKRENGEILTSKVDYLNHGIGLKSIKESLKKYDGSYEIEYTDKKFTINMYIPIC